MEIKIKIEGLNQLTEAITLMGAAMAYRGKMVSTAKTAVELIDEIKGKSVEELEEKTANNQEKKEEEEGVKSKFTREDVRAAFVAKNSPSTREKLKALLDKYNTPNISELDEKHFDSVIKDLEEI